MTNDNGFEWMTAEDLQSASDDELVAQVVALQQRLRELETEVESLQEVVYLLLDLQAGVFEDAHPDLAAWVDAHDHQHAPEENESN